jgi:hypothetical protein
MKPRNLLLILISFCSIIYNSGCASSEIGESTDVAQETIYQQYNISFMEGDENVVVNASFRFAGDKGTTLVLTKPSRVQFDGIDLTVDSTDFEGAFYKKSLLVNSFMGEHQFRFIDLNKQKYDNDFSFDGFKWLNIPVFVSRNQVLPIEFETGLLGPDDYIEVGALDTDSTFSVIYSGKDTSDSFIIPANELQRQSGAWLKLSATLHKKSNLQQPTAEGGVLEMNYSLKPILIRLK